MMALFQLTCLQGFKIKDQMINICPEKKEKNVQVDAPSTCLLLITLMSIKGDAVPQVLYGRVSKVLNNIST